MASLTRAAIGKLVLALVLIAGLVSLWAVREYQDFRSEALTLPPAGLIYTLAPGTSLRGLARDLKRRGVLSNGLWLRLLGRHKRLAARIQAGEYHFAVGTTPQQLLQQLAQGRVRQHELTLVEGHTFRQMMARIQAHEALQHSLQELPDAEIMRRIGYEGMHPEGRFLPDTYHFPRGTRDVEFLRRAYAAMEALLARAWAQRQPELPLKTPYEALILASIVEKETGVAEERPAIAGVFSRRLQKRMRLQTDPTVIYGMGTDFDGDIRFRDLRRDTPYNTYTRGGLPPTPIAMPGRAAIEAVMHPAPGEALYFVAKGDGSHQFSATLAEHNRAVDRYQRKR